MKRYKGDSCAEDQPLLRSGAVDSLPKDATGTYVVRTKTSCYLLDLDERKAVRCPGRKAIDEWDVAQLRKDGTDVTLVDWSVKVGERMLLLLHGVADDPEVYTQRRTTPVVSIELPGNSTRLV